MDDQGISTSYYSVIIAARESQIRADLEELAILRYNDQRRAKRVREAVRR
jgi:hypothetical protein